MEPIIRMPLLAAAPRRIGRIARIDEPATAPIAPVPKTKLEFIPPAAPPVQQANPAPVPDLVKLEAELRLKYKQEYETALLQMQERAEQAGYAAGFKKGEEDAQRAVAQKTEQLVALIKSIGEAKQQTLDASEDMLVEIAFAAVCRIMGATAVTRDAVIGMVREASAHCRDRNAWKVHLNPQDYELLQQATDASGQLPCDGRVVLERSSSVQLGGCMIESETGMLDARLEVQMERLRDALLAARRAANGMKEQA